MKRNEIIEGLRDPKDNPCWKGYKPVGTKKKGGKTVPNCVPNESISEEYPPVNVPKGWEAKTQPDGSTRISKIGSMSSADYKQNMANYKAQNWTPEKMADYSNRMASGQGYTDAEKYANYQAGVKATGREDPETLAMLIPDENVRNKLQQQSQQQKHQPLEGRRNYDDNRTGFSRGHDHRGLEQELAHETNNYAVAIDGRTWKVFASKNHAQAVARSLQNKGKKATVHETGAEPTNEAVKKEAPKPRNFVAKNAKMGGAGQHKDKKKAEKQGDAKHKKPFYEQNYTADEMVDILSGKKTQAQVDAERKTKPQTTGQAPQQPKTPTPPTAPKPAKEASGELKVQKDDDKSTVLLNPATGVQTQIDKTNPNSPRLTQDPTGKLKLSAPQGAQSGGMEQKPNLAGKSVSIETPPLEDVDPDAMGSNSPIGGDEEHDEISRLLVKKLQRLAGL